MMTNEEINKARIRLTEYMLFAAELEKDGLIHRNGILAAVLNIDRKIIDEAIK
jgi:hypothetical protein